MENSKEIAKRVDLSYDPAIPLLSIYLKKKKNTNLKNYMHFCVYFGALLMVAKIWKQPKCSSMDKEDVAHVYIYNGILLLLLLSRFSRVRLCATP